MSRILCSNCHRPERGCICSFITEIDNNIHIVVLQHPSEVSQTKGTIALLAKSFRSCQVLIGEDFSQDECFLQVMEQYRPVLLYPGDQAKILTDGGVSQLSETLPDLNKSEEKDKPLCLVVLDGTWKKAYRMYMVSSNLHQLMQVCLPDELANSGQYHIRKVAKKNALSSLEASCYALALLEEGSDTFNISLENAGKYQPLLDKFQQFNQFQLSFRPGH
ncbi:MAG: DTW domain-containing protein [Colwellia sp.]|nr:DTW domain-containing protein [Colwellia sp.]